MQKKAGGECTTLVVDEDVNVRSELYQILNKVFREKGIKNTLVVAKDTESSINVVEGVSPNLIFLGQECSFDVIDFAINRGYDFDWLLMTERSQNNKVEAEKRGVKCFLNKPFDKQMVSAAVEIALGL